MNLDSLNDKQKEAVTTTEGRIRVIAGAGSGKTRALAYRYAYLVNEIGIDPANILCLTFTNKAAREMKTRIASLVPPGMSNDYICTVHAFCVRFLREEIHRIGYPKNFKVIDEEDMSSLAKEVLMENGIDRKDATIRDLLKGVYNYKMQRLGDNYITEVILPSNSAIPEEERISLVNQFILKQKKYLSLDFNDLGYFTHYILEHFNDVLEEWASKMQYVMVDEVQDNALIEWSIFEPLSSRYNNLFIVGDPDQSIYEWRGATPSALVHFKADKDIIMAENYRSTSIILDAANSIISNNKMRVDKDLFTRQEPGSILTHFHAPMESLESDWIAKKIIKLRTEGCAFSDIAILYRASFLSRSLEQSLIKHGISYVIWGGIRFFERKEIKDSLCYLRLISSHDDDLAFKRICNVPSRKIGKVTFGKIQDIAKRYDCSLFEALKIGVEEGTFSEASITSFVNLIDSGKTMAAQSTLSDLVNWVLNNSGLTDLYRADGDEDKLENIAELLNSVKMYEEDNREDESSLQKYLQDIALYTNTDYSKDTDKVKLMTIHQSKGLEFPFVFITGLSEGIFPNQRSIREHKQSGLEEERRLMYVAVTRAEKALFMTESEGYCPQASGNKVPSRFIREIKNNLYVTEGEMDADLWKGTDSFIANEKVMMSLRPSTDENIEAGTTVIHNHLGKGVVISTKDGYAVVNFDVLGDRRVNVSTLHASDSVNEKISNCDEKSLDEMDEHIEPISCSSGSHVNDSKEAWGLFVNKYAVDKPSLKKILNDAEISIFDSIYTILTPTADQAERINVYIKENLECALKEFMKDQSLTVYVKSMERGKEEGQNVRQKSRTQRHESVSKDTASTNVLNKTDMDDANAKDEIEESNSRKHNLIKKLFFWRNR